MQTILPNPDTYIPDSYEARSLAEQIGRERFDQLLLSVEKPGRYAGGEPGSIVKELQEGQVSFAFCFPDTYEVGMSHLGMKILYGLLNSMDFVRCERAFMPWVDFRALLIRERLPLFSLETKTPLSSFDFLGFTLQYELSYTNVLDMLYLSGIPLRSAARGEKHPLIIAGGPCACNPEPMADFVDLFVLGEGEEVTAELMELYRKNREAGGSKAEFLRQAAGISGVYVPAFYEVDYEEDGRVRSVTPRESAPLPVRKRIVKDLNTAYYPEHFVVPFLDVVHNRAMAEVFRGCIRGCRFCQAGFIYRPVREKSPETVNRQARALCENTGYGELSLSSLSTGDYSALPQLLSELLTWSDDSQVAVSLPSLRIDKFPKEILERLGGVKKMGLTFAPEAGTQRMRDVINKNITEEEILDTCKMAFENGYTSVKLYFMMGLPYETVEDIEGIAELAQKIVDAYYHGPRQKGKGVTVSVSAAVFVPKPHTPFQWFPQDSPEQVQEKQRRLRESIRTKKVSLSWHDMGTSVLEAVFARGDRRLSRVLEMAHREGCLLDGWSEFFHFEKWIKIIKDCGLDPNFYVRREREYDEILPWDHLDYGVGKRFLIRENELAKQGKTTPNCREHCTGCGAAAWKEGICIEAR